MSRIPRHKGRASPKIGPSDSSDTFSDRPDKPATDSDAGGTGERTTVEQPPRAKDVGPDRVARDREVGLGGGLDQAEEAQQGLTDEEIAKRKKGR